MILELNPYKKIRKKFYFLRGNLNLNLIFQDSSNKDSEIDTYFKFYIFSIFIKIILFSIFKYENENLFYNSNLLKSK